MKRSALLVTAALLAAAPATATTVMMVSDESLLQQADLVVRARIVGRVSAAATGGHPRTGWNAAVTEVLKGRYDGTNLRLSILGGTASNGMTFKAYGAPAFREGQSTLLFLARRSDGDYEPLHLFLGAFHEVETVSGRVAVRDLSQVRAISLEGQATPREPLRDARLFAEWISARAQGVEMELDYAVKADDDSMRSIHDEFTFFQDGNLKLRWSAFDGGGSVSFRMKTGGQPGVPGGGFSQFQSAINAWNADPNTVIKYTYGGTTGSDGGFENFDGKNTLLTEDPNNEISGSFSCASGGVLAMGGPWFGNATSNHNGQQFRKIEGADIIGQNGLQCFFNESPNAGKAFEELFGHELGHTLGLDHSSESPSEPNNTLAQALMYFAVHDDARGAQLNADDRGGIAVLYGSGSTPPAAPSGLEAAALSSTRVMLLFNDNANNETAYRIEVKQGAGAFNDIGSVGANATSVVVSGLSAGTAYSFRVRAESSGVFSGYSNEASATTHSSTVNCVQDADTLCLNSGRFEVEVLFRTTAGAAFSKAGRANAGTPASGLFFFFAADNWELLLKTVNGCGLNNHHWLFYAATTNVEFIITATDRQSGLASVYYNELNNTAAPVQDTEAFATCP